MSLGHHGIIQGAVCIRTCRSKSNQTVKATSIPINATTKV